MQLATIIRLRAAAAITATDTGPAVDVADFVGIGYLVLNSSATGGAGQTSNVKIQHSDDPGDDGSEGWTDSGAAFAPVTNAAASHQALLYSLDRFKRFIRVVNTLAGTTPTVTAGVSLVGKKDHP